MKCLSSLIGISLEIGQDKGVKDFSMKANIRYSREQSGKARYSQVQPGKARYSQVQPGTARYSAKKTHDVLYFQKAGALRILNMIL